MLVIGAVLPIMAGSVDKDNIETIGSNCDIQEQTIGGNFAMTSWIEKTKLLASDGEQNDRFAVSVSIDGDYAIVGAFFDDDNGDSSGSAYIFKCTDGNWSEEQKLTASDSEQGDRFAVSVSIDGDYAIIGADNDDELMGSAYIFKRTDDVWSEEQKLTASDGIAGDNFGISVSIDGDYAIIGAYVDDNIYGYDAGSAYVFKCTDDVWSEEQKLIASDGAAFDKFGFSVSIDGDYAIVGAFFDDDRTGSAYVFVCTDDVWSEEQKLIASDGAAYDYFSRSVSIDGNYAIIGAKGDDDQMGSAYVFKRTDISWSEEQKLNASDGATGDNFGDSVSIDGNYAIIGASNNNNTGSAYIFKCTCSSWSEEQKLNASDGATGDNFGGSVSINGATSIIGAPWDNDNGNGSGSAYIFEYYNDEPPVNGWPMIAQNPAHTAFSSTTTPDTNETLFIQDAISGSVLGGISVANDKLYVGTLSTNLYCLDAYTGEIIFEHNNPGLLVSVPAIDAQNIYFGSLDGNVYCLDAETGAEQWTYAIGNQISGSPVLNDNKIFVGSRDDKMYCLDTNGVEIWNYVTSGNIENAPAVVDGKIYFGSDDDKVYCLDANDGSFIWEYLTGGNVRTYPTVDNGKVFIGSMDNSIYCIDADDGSLIWEYITGNDPASQAVYNNKVYVGSKDNKFYCLNTENGNIVWNFSTPNWVLSSPAIADGKVYFGDRAKNYYCLNAETGDIIWHYLDTKMTESAFAIYNGIIYSAGSGSSNRIIAFGITNESPEVPAQPDGETEGQIDVEYEYSASTTDPDGDQVYYMWDFGDETTDWIGPFDSGVEVSQAHTWTTVGTYDVKVKAKDSSDAESNWSSALEVTITELIAILEIGNITGGMLSVSAEIKNTGDADATNVVIKTKVTGGILGRIDKELTQNWTDLPPGQTFSQSIEPIFGLGPIEIIITANADGIEEINQTVDGFVILFYVIVN